MLGFRSYSFTPTHCKTRKHTHIHMFKNTEYLRNQPTMDTSFGAMDSEMFRVFALIVAYVPLFMFSTHSNLHSRGK